MAQVQVTSQTHLFDAEPVFPLTRVVSPPTKSWSGAKYVPNQKPTQQHMPAVNRRTLMGIPAQGGTK